VFSICFDGLAFARDACCGDSLFAILAAAAIGEEEREC